MMNFADDIGDVAAPLFAADLQFPGLWVTDIVEVDAVDVVAARHLTAEAGDVVAGLWHLGVHVALLTRLHDEFREALTHQFAAVGVPLAYGDGDDPCVALHAALVALVDTELEDIVAGRSARLSCETGIPWLAVVGEDSGGSHARLK